jgi:hypothetical protein
MCVRRVHTYSITSSAPARREGHGETKRLGGLEVDHQLEFRRLFDRQVGRFGAQYSVDMGTGSPNQAIDASPIRNEPTASKGNRRQVVLFRTEASHAQFEVHG